MAKSYDHNVQVFDDGQIFIDKFTVNEEERDKVNDW